MQRVYFTLTLTLNRILKAGLLRRVHFKWATAGEDEISDRVGAIEKVT